MLDKTYQPNSVEEKIYKLWEDGGYFTPQIPNKKNPTSSRSAGLRGASKNKIFFLVVSRLETYKKDAKTANHPLCGKLLDELEHDLKKYSKKLEDAVTGLAKEGKYGFCEKC